MTVPIVRNRILYGALFLVILAAAVLYADPFMFKALYALTVMPVVSLAFAALTLYGLELTQKTQGGTVIKGEPGRYTITLRNLSHIGFGTAHCLFIDGDFAVETNADDRRLEIRPFMKPTRFDIGFTVNYRGKYQLGLEYLEVEDFLGIFRLRRKVGQRFEIVAYPKITDMEHMELASHLLSKAPANLALANEDYADFTDVRPYEHTDPIKKVHWKLTAKRGEWIVKNYQSSVLNSVAILLDANKRVLPREVSVKLEDSMVERSVGILHYCLRSQMPVDLQFGRSVRHTGRHIGDFEAVYDVIASLDFAEEGFSVNQALDGYLNESSRNINAVILTSELDMQLHDQILNAIRFGHYIAVMYFVPENWTSDKESDRIFDRLKASGINSIKIVGGFVKNAEATQA